MNPEMKVHFKIIGDEFDPEEVTQLLRIAPSKTWRKGDTVARQATLTRKHSGWQTSASSRQGVDFGPLIRDVLERVRPVSGTLSGIKKSEHVDFELACVAYIYDETPILNLSEQMVKEIADIGAEIDVDVMLMLDEDGNRK